MGNDVALVAGAHAVATREPDALQFLSREVSKLARRILERLGDGPRAENSVVRLPARGLLGGEPGELGRLELLPLADLVRLGAPQPQQLDRPQEMAAPSRWRGIVPGRSASAPGGTRQLTRPDPATCRFHGPEVLPC